MQRYDLRRNDEGNDELVVSENGEFLRYADVRRDLEARDKAGAEAQARATKFSARIDELEKSIPEQIAAAVGPAEKANAQAAVVFDNIRKLVTRVSPDERDKQIADLRADLDAATRKAARL